MKFKSIRYCKVRNKILTRQAGFSLVELLVSITITLIVLTGVLGVVQNSRVSYETEQESSFIQENLRYATLHLLRDIRGAGNSGCASGSSSLVANVLDGDLDGMMDSDGIIGFEGTNAIIPSEWPDAFELDATVGSDAVILRYADPDTELSIKSSNYTSAVLNVWGTNPFDEGQILMIVDSTCRHTGIFQTNGGNTIKIGHNSGGSVSPGNCTKVLFASNTSFNCSASPCNAVSCGGNPAAPYGNGSSVMTFVANAYYIGESNVIPGMPALKRQVLTSTGSRSEELAQGVESMELKFGVSTETDPDTDDIYTGDNAEIFLDADEVADWDRVMAVRYSLILRSQTELYDSNHSVTLNGITYNDKYLRQVASATVRIRNRGENRD